MTPQLQQTGPQMHGLQTDKQEVHQTWPAQAGRIEGMQRITCMMLSPAELRCEGLATVAPSLGGQQLVLLLNTCRTLQPQCSSLLMHLASNAIRANILLIMFRSEHDVSALVHMSSTAVSKQCHKQSRVCSDQIQACCEMLTDTMFRSKQAV